MQPIAYVDYDGTIINSMPRHYMVFDDCLQMNKLDLKVEYIQFVNDKRDGMSTRQICLKHGYDDYETNIICNFWQNHIEDDYYIAKDELFSDAEDFLKSISCYYDVVLLSARNNLMVIEQIKSLPISQYITEIKIVNPANASREKTQFITIKGFKDAILIGDTETEYNISKLIKINTYLLNRGFRSDEFWKQYGVNSYNNLDDIKKLLKG